MLIEQFERLSEHEKKVQLFEAKKITERSDSFSRYELFYLDNFFIESKTSQQKTFKRTLTCYTLSELPLIYAGHLHFLWS